MRLYCIINVANKYITNHGLRFNPDKTECSIFGPHHLELCPVWNIDEVALLETDHVKYVGVHISHLQPNMHVKSRLNSCQKADHALQCVGLGSSGSSVDMVAYVWNTTCTSGSNIWFTMYSHVKESVG